MTSQPELDAVDAAAVLIVQETQNDDADDRADDVDKRQYDVDHDYPFPKKESRGFVKLVLEFLFQCFDVAFAATMMIGAAGAKIAVTVILFLLN